MIKIIFYYFIDNLFFSWYYFVINIVDGTVDNLCFSESLRLVKANKQNVISTPEILAKSRADCIAKFAENEWSNMLN